MKMIEISGNGFIEPREFGVDQEVMVARALAIGARRSNSHSAQSKVNHGLRRDRGAVLEVDEVDCGAGWRSVRTASGRGLRASGACAQGSKEKQRPKSDFSHMSLLHDLPPHDLTKSSRTHRRAATGVTG